MASELTQIYYREEQKKEIYPFAIPYFNGSLTIFFENSVIADVVEASEAEKIGVCSWKLREKQRWNVGSYREITKDLIESDYKVLSFTKNSGYHRMLQAAEVWHEGFNESLKIILNKIGIAKPDEVDSPINNNHFMAEKSIFKDYVREYLRPAMAVMKDDQQCHELAMKDSGYLRLVRMNAATPDELVNKLGVNYYPMAPFLLERLFPIYCHNKKIKVTYI